MFCAKPCRSNFLGPFSTYYIGENRGFNKKRDLYTNEDASFHTYHYSLNVCVSKLIFLTGFDDFPQKKLPSFFAKTWPLWALK